MSKRSCLTVILAAGEGTRMKSDMPKVLHKVAGLAMVGHVAKAAVGTGGSDIALVVGRGGDAVAEAVKPFAPKASVHEQKQRLGTAHAVLAARDAIARGYDDILVVFGDTPLVEASALSAARRKIAEGAAVAVVGFHTPNPTGYGRLIEERGELTAIREEKDASPPEKAITYCNAGLMAISGKRALTLLEAVGNSNAKGEYYLTDIVAIARSRNLKVVATEVDAGMVLGVNTLIELAEAEAAWQNRKRRALMLAGVTMTAPETVFFSEDTEVAGGALIEPNVFFGPGVTIRSGAKIRAYCHIEGAIIGDSAEVGPFARLRPEADLHKGAKVGNFCEVKKAVIHEGAKVNHLTYIGDAVVGPGANIGAGTITCNYDGFLKHVTKIGANAFIGSNSALVAPVSIGDGAYIASGSVITDDVPADALALGRARQVNKDGAGARLKTRLKAAKEAKKAN
jgi:bifunctional UDP-N-acetylglucosamine pyrophosphorylase/glucosamine-1-phosphate N-acetyltransferase